MKQNKNGDSASSSFCGHCSNLLINGQSYSNEINDLHGQIDGIRFRLLDTLVKLNTSTGEKSNANRCLLANKVWSGLKIPLDKRTEILSQDNDGK